MANGGSKGGVGTSDANGSRNDPAHQEDARANVPPKLEKDDWNCPVDLWSKQDYMKEKTGHSPSRIELFDITHVQANGQAVNEPTQDALVALRNLTTQVNEGALQISQDQMFMEVFGPERHGRVCGYGVGVTPTKLWVPPHLEYKEVFLLHTKVDLVVTLGGDGTVLWKLEGTHNG
nr:hypothetical protein CFP56_50625 [Quercus suber]